MDKTSLFIISVLFVLTLFWTGFIASIALESRRIAQEITAANERMMQQHQNFLANQATILRDNDRMLHQHDTTTQEHRAILQRLAH